MINVPCAYTPSFAALMQIAVLFLALFLLLTFLFSYIFNILGENSIRSLTIGRKNWLFSELPGVQFGQHPEFIKDYLPWCPEVQGKCEYGKILDIYRFLFFLSTMSFDAYD